MLTVKKAATMIVVYFTTIIVLASGWRLAIVILSLGDGL